MLGLLKVDLGAGGGGAGGVDLGAGELRRVALSRQAITWASRRSWKSGRSRDGSS